MKNLKQELYELFYFGYGACHSVPYFCAFKK